MSEKTPKSYWNPAEIAQDTGALPTVICPRTAPKFPLNIAHCSCGYVCSATSEDSTDAALFAHVVAYHTVPASDLLTR